MLTFFFILALVGVLALCLHVTLELNSLEKAVAGLAEALEKRYGTVPHETTAGAGTGQSKGS